MDQTSIEFKPKYDLESYAVEIRKKAVESDDSDNKFKSVYDCTTLSIKAEDFEESDTQNTNDTNSTFSDSEFNEEDIKDVKKEVFDIEIEDHGIKLEIDENGTETKLEQEIENEAQSSEVKFKCKRCNYESQNNANFKKHLSLHQDPNKVLLYFCTKCTYRTRQKCHLKRHDLIHQSPDELKMFRCEICNFETKQKCTLKRHINSVHLQHPRPGDKKNNTIIKSELFACSKCPYRTLKRGLMISHMDKHKDNQDLNNLYICDVCSFSTKYRRNLRVHLITHKDTQKLQVYSCKLCNFKTRMGYCLKRHFLSKKHLLVAGRLEEYSPRTQKT